ncbi:MAG: hypothetical protein KJO22_11105 [Bacteroidia bacterium]|nr:hypothetical protein [Winogradskyella sp.]MBT8377409.1 hypothetical protein [Bacteroidia bacterium]NNL82622.1 hypothetical protein [Winogradskyella sp.]
MKKVLATVVGLVAAAAVILVFEFLGEMFFPLPEQIDITDVDSIKANMDKIPTGSLVFVIMAHFLGILAGMVVTTYVSKETLVPVLVVGGILLLATLINLFVLPHPIWFTIADILAVILGFLVGRSLSKQRITRLNSI